MLSGGATPGLAVPGAMNPGLAVPFSAPAAQWIFAGTERLYYLQYLGPDGHVLSPSPGASYDAGSIMVASGQEAALADPPADGRWIIT